MKPGGPSRICLHHQVGHVCFYRHESWSTGWADGSEPETVLVLEKQLPMAARPDRQGLCLCPRAPCHHLTSPRLQALPQLS